MKFKLLVILSTLLFVSPIFGQTKDSDYEWSEAASHHSSVVRVYVPLSSDETANAAGVLIHVTNERVKNGRLGYVLTAAHVIEGYSTFRSRNGIIYTNISIEFSNGKKSAKCQVVKIIEEDGSDGSVHDLALIYVWVPDGINPVNIAKKAPVYKDEVEIVGWGNGKFRHHTARAARPSSEETIIIDSWSLGGDSGGPIFNKNHEVVGIIAGGWFWNRKKKPSRTWPTRGSGIKLIKELIKDKF